MPPLWLILADDLTGAADCAIAFAKRGMDSVVTWGDGTDGTASVLSVNTDSRGLPAGAAAARQVAAQAAHWRSGMRLYKKIDSTLRGQPAAELAAQLSALAAGSGRRAPLAVVAPAFPAAGRVTLGGSVVVNGQRLEETPLWARDHTYANAHLPDVLASAGLPAEEIPLDVVRAGPEAVRARMDDAQRRGVAAVVCDGVAGADLDVTAAASVLLADAVWVGSAGLAGALAALISPTGSVQPALPAHPGGVLTVVGSLAEISRVQARVLVENGLVREVAVTPETLLAGPQVPGWQAAQISLSEELTAGRDILLEIAVAPNPDLTRGPELVAQLAALAAPVAPRVGALVATGGETVCALLSRFGIHGIRLLDEVEPGVPLGMTVGALSFPVVTKAGGFGDADTLRRALARLRS